MKVTVELSGGMEILFQNQKSLVITPTLPTLTSLLASLEEVCSKPELLLDNDRVKPGILVLINDVDSELVGESLNDGDVVVLISTLHGG
jgi:ubiquitin related modifier 1